MTEVLTQPMIEGAAISALIPQKSPIEMVDKLWFNDERTTVSGFTVKEDNIFCKDGYFNEPGIIENIAQTAAIRAGYMASLLMKDGIPGTPPVGYIGAIKKLVIHQLPKAGAELKTEITVQQVVFDVTLISGRSTVDGEPVAECEMKIFLKR
ncbi:MAG: hydroxymyristoyl-ACP dehydratase [Bacteroidota bacterium]|jgi:3-hydroxymyristoyl/3-hydroxydecanoyl-(acyl carrier protein) dehydratase|nr:hydroxymyristoyl-ACP dehydratase [Bacteroidota bacterium]